MNITSLKISAFHHLKKIILLFLLTLYATVSSADTFEAGAYIIDMGVVPQTVGNAIKPYGMIYDLIVNAKVPVYWSIKPNKTKDAADFTYNGKDYKGGSFIISAKFATEAATIISNWKAKGVIVDGPTNIPFDAPVYALISNFPKSVLDTENGDIIAAAFYQKAEIPSTYYRIGTPDDINACDDIFALPHADPEFWPTATINNFSSYIYGGGYLWAGCRAASGIENTAKGLGLHFLSNSGLIDHTDHADQSGTAPVILASSATHPLMQMMGELGMIGGSEEVYLPETTGWRASTTLAVTDPNQTDVSSGLSPGAAALVAYGFANGNSNYGMVVYEASHDIAKNGTEPEKVAATRLYGNFLLMSGIDKKIEVTASNLSTAIVAGSPSTFSVTAPTATSYLWTSSCGGFFTPNANVATVKFHAPSSAIAATCIVKVAISDNCGRSTFLTSALAPPPLCNAYTGDKNAGLSPNLRLKSGDTLFLASSTVSPMAGHLQAYTQDINGLPSGAALWDAADNMSTSRASRLYSTSSTGAKILFQNLPDAAFVPNGTAPSVATIKNYTLDPAYLKPSYLAGRDETSVLGSFAEQTSLALIGGDIDTLAYLNKAAYRTFYNNTIATRSTVNQASNPKQILAGSDDGFLYAFNQGNGELVWGWMPRSLLKELYDYNNFQQKHLMLGKLDVLDVKDSNGYATYVIGSYKQGLGQFVLKLSATTSQLESIVWDADYQNSITTAAPMHGERAYFSDGTDHVYTVFITTDNTNISTLHIRSLTDSTMNDAIPLGYNVTSAPFIIKEGNNKTLYLGDSVGNVHAVALLDATKMLASTTMITTGLSSTLINIGASSPIHYLGAVVAEDLDYYLRAQSNDRLTLFKYDASSSNWTSVWTIYSGGNGRWNGSNFVNDTNIQSLPSNAILSANAFVVANSLVLPVTLAPTGNNCYGTAHYYLYKLQNGHFPTAVFYNSDNSAISHSINNGIIDLGYGAAHRLQIATMQNSNKLIGLGVATQTLSNETGISKSFYIKERFTTGIRSWRELR